MNEQVANVFVVFLYLLIFAILIRSLLSWFPIRRDHELVRLLDAITEPLLEPVRRMLPRTGMIDLSAMVVMIVLYIMVAVVQTAARQ